MTEIYRVLEIADANGQPTGTYRYVSYSDEASRPIYHPLCEHAHASRQEAEECPVAKEHLDRAFQRGKYRVLTSDERLIIALGSALAKARRALRLAEKHCQVMLHLPDQAEFDQYTKDLGAADLGCGLYYGWREEHGLLTDGEREPPRFVDPDAPAPDVGGERS